MSIPWWLSPILYGMFFLLVLANALSVLAQILVVLPRDDVFYENDNIMVKSHHVHENSGV